MTDNAHDLTLASEGLQTPSSMLSGTTSAIERLVPLYERIKIAGILVVTGVVLALVTVALAIFGHYTPLAKSPLGEEILVGSLALLFVALGVLFQTGYNGMKTKIELESLKIGSERNVMVHEETMEKLKLPPSTPAAPNAPVPEGESGSHGPSTG